jgi:catechol 2,3-dioxygenase-like lactoylglutathione lyase family enzyme
MLKGAPLVGFISTTDMDRSRAFYEGVLGLEVQGFDGFAMTMDVDGNMVRIVKPPQMVPLPYTVLGFEVTGIEDKVAGLIAKGVAFERYDFFGEAQDPSGVWNAPGGDKVAWFKDPDGNLLSLSQHVHRAH